MRVGDSKLNRIFTGKDKRHLYVAAGGRCEKCGETLGDDWEAHHMKRYADGGVTAIQNGAALCRECHKAMHRRSTSMSVIKPRGWQSKALRNFLTAQGKSFLVEATPGAGKTIFSGLCAKELLEDGAVTFVVIVVPTTALKGDAEAGFLGDWNKIGVDITPVLRDGKPPQKDFHGAVVTYQQLPNLVSTFETWARNGQKVFFVFDEIHHATESNSWGAAAEACGAVGERVLCMSGTPFRGDGRRISFVRYDENETAIADAEYSYREAVRDRVCREVLFAHDNGVAEYLLNGELNEVRISDTTEENASMAAATIFRKDSRWLETVIAKADAKLDEYRASDIDAGGIVICRPGTDDNDDRHLMQVAWLVSKVTGESPAIVTHDDPDANAKIEHFRKSGIRWICAVRKISEGVDIKRLRVMVMATKPGTELLFRQMVGRVVRVDDKSKLQDATVYMARFPQMEEWSKRIEDEAKSGLKETAVSGGEPKERGEMSSDFSPVGATHEDGGGTTSFGEQFNSQEILQAEELKRGDVALADIPVATIAHILRKQGVEPADEYAGKPKHQRKKEIRQEINNLVRRIAIGRNPEQPDFSGVWRAIHRHIGVRGIDDLMDNHDISKMEQVRELLRNLMVDGGRNVA